MRLVPMPTYRRKSSGGGYIESGKLGRNVSTETLIGRRITIQPDGCWTFRTGSTYGKVRGFRAHRYVYEVLVGPVPDGCILHHICQVSTCCNPEHLIPLTPEEHGAEHGRLNSDRTPPSTTCGESMCGATLARRGLCWRHYREWLAHY
jgi:hypothetical protein